MDQRPDRTGDDERYQLVGSIVASGFMSRLVIGVGLERAVGRFAQPILEDAFIDAAELLDREIAVIDVFRAAGSVVAQEVAEPEDHLRHCIVGKLDAIEDRRDGGIEKAAVVWRDA